jgi:ZIP family zinc transporter
MSYVPVGPCMINYAELLLLGAIAGLTIFLGLPMALLQNVSPRKKGFLNALSMGILVFLIADVLANAWGPTKLATINAYTGVASFSNAAQDLVALFAGLGIGLLGLASYEQRYIRRISLALKASARPAGEIKRDELNGPATRTQSVSQEQRTALFGSPYHLATMIAMSIGLHNFSEGLAIGQSYASGAVALAVVLIVGFGAHNATEGFGIAGPLTGILEKPRISFLAKLGLIGGGPTFVGTIIGSLWVSELTYVLFLSLAAGALVYVTLLMYNAARRQSSNDLIMVGIFIGLLAGFLTDLLVSLGGA